MATNEQDFLARLRAIQETYGQVTNPEAEEPDEVPGTRPWVARVQQSVQSMQDSVAEAARAALQRIAAGTAGVFNAVREAVPEGSALPARPGEAPSTLQDVGVPVQPMTPEGLQSMVRVAAQPFSSGLDLVSDLYGLFGGGQPSGGFRASMEALAAEYPGRVAPLPQEEALRAPNFIDQIVGQPQSTVEMTADVLSDVGVELAGLVGGASGIGRGARNLESMAGPGKVRDLLRLVGRDPSTFGRGVVRDIARYAPVEAAFAEASPERSTAVGLRDLTSEPYQEAVRPELRPAMEAANAFLNKLPLDSPMGRAIAEIPFSTLFGLFGGLDADLGRNLERLAAEIDTPEAAASLIRNRGGLENLTHEERLTVGRFDGDISEIERAIAETRPAAADVGAAEDAALTFRQRLAQWVDPEVRQVRERVRDLEAERFTDDLTQLQNQNAWRQARGVVDADPERAVVAIDLRNFKGVNDIQGHDAGDAVLQEVGAALRQVSEEFPGVSPFRVGGDEFTVAVTRGQSDPDAVAARIRELVPERAIGDSAFRFGVDVGVGETTQAADEAAMAAKRAAKEGQASFRPDLGAEPPAPRREVREFEGEPGNTQHITRTENGPISTATLADLPGVKGEVRGAHRNRQGPKWEEFKADIAARGIQDPIFVTVDPGVGARISEGNHRLDAAVELGLDEVPVEIRYFGHAERQHLLDDLEPTGRTRSELDDGRVRHTRPTAAVAEGPVVERVSRVDPRAPDADEYVYHVTSEPNAERILREGFQAGEPTAGRGGGYEANSRGRTFFTDAKGVSEWEFRIENHLFDQFDDPPDVAILRIPKSAVPDLRPDDIQDVPGSVSYMAPTESVRGLGAEPAPPAARAVGDVSPVARVRPDTQPDESGNIVARELVPEDAPPAGALPPGGGPPGGGPPGAGALPPGRPDPLDPGRGLDLGLGATLRALGRTISPGVAGAAVGAAISDEHPGAGALVGGAAGLGAGAMSAARALRKAAFAETRTIRNMGTADSNDVLKLLNSMTPQNREIIQRKARQAWLDEVTPVTALMDELRRVDPARADDWTNDLELFARLTRGDRGYAERTMDKGVMGPTDVRPRSRGWNDIMRDMGDRAHEWSMYAIGRRVAHLEATGSPERVPVQFRPGTAERAEIDAVLENADDALAGWFDDFQQINRSWMEVMEEVGAIAPGSAKKILDAQGDNYIPFFRQVPDVPERASGVQAGSRRSLIHRQRAIRTMTGSEKELPVIYPIESIMRLHYVFGNAVHRQRANNALARIAQTLRANDVESEFIFKPDRREITQAVRFEPSDLRGQVSRRTEEAIERDRQMSRVRRELRGTDFEDTDPATAIREAARQLGIEEEALLEAVPPDMLRIFTGQKPDPAQRIVRIYDETGKAEYWKLSEEMWDAVQGAEPWQIEGLAGMVYAAGTGLARTLRTVVTAMPDFAVRNLIRDTSVAAITSGAKGRGFRALTNAWYDALGGASVLLSESLPLGFRAGGGAALGAIGGAVTLDQGEGSWRRGAAMGSLIGFGLGTGAGPVARRFAGQIGLTPEELLNGFANTGAMQAAYQTIDMRSIRQTIKQQMQEAGKGEAAFWSNVMHPMQTLRAFGMASENASRVGEMHRILKSAGVDASKQLPALQNASRFTGPIEPELLTRAGAASRDVTVDFARHGSSAIVSALRPIAAFWNARLQGMDKLYRVFSDKDHRGRAATVAMSSITLPSLMLYGVNRMNPEYWETNIYERNLFWLVPLPQSMGGGFARIPKPFELGLVFGSFMERMVEFVDPANPENRDTSALGETVATAIEDMVTSVVLPDITALTPVVENMQNKDFTGLPLVSPYDLASDDPDWQKGAEESSQFARLWGRWLDVPPPFVDNVVSGYTGRLGPEVLEGVDRLLRDVEETGPSPATAVRDRFLTRSFFTREPARTSRAVSVLYDKLSAAEEAYALLKFHADRGETDKFDQALEANTKTLDGLTAYRDAAKELAELRKMAEAMEADPDLTAKQKRELIDETYRSATAIAQRVLGWHE